MFNYSLRDKSCFTLNIGLIVTLSVLMQSCGNTDANLYPSFEEVYQFLKQHTDVLLLERGQAAIAVVPSYQGRVMTSTYNRESGPGLGWLNYELIEQGVLPKEERLGTLQNHIHAFGGEERFWLGPEGGQFGILFEPGSEFIFEDWHTPAAIDTNEYEIVNQNNEEVTFSHQATFTNWSGTNFEVEINRTVRLLTKEDIAGRLGITLPEDVRMVAYETENSIKNIGNFEWNRETGMLSIWILGMYPPTPKTTVVIPIKKGPEELLGTKVNDDYFGEIPDEYLKVNDHTVFFKGDGTYRSKIGISPERSLGIAGSYVEEIGVLNIVTYNEPDANPGYVNSMWEMQEEPFSGDVINAYNDGPPAPGEDPLGPFYELETSSPAANLSPGETMQHSQTTIHIKGSDEMIDQISNRLFGVSVEEIKDKFD
ncbi:MAG: hypothetical protein RI575_06900 [Balneolaceae bacterium]|nr:hypothetical protein [Balneolaceae bacterium]